MKRIREQSFRESRNTSFRHTQRRDYNFLKDFIEVHIRRLHIHVFSSSLFVWQISRNISVLLFRALCILRRFLGKEYIALYHVSYSIITHSSFSNPRIRPSQKISRRRSIASWSSSMATTCYVNNIERRFFSRFPNSFKSDWPRAFFFFDAFRIFATVEIYRLLWKLERTLENLNSRHAFTKYRGLRKKDKTKMAECQIYNDFLNIEFWKGRLRGEVWIGGNFTESTFHSRVN